MHITSKKNLKEIKKIKEDNQKNPKFEQMKKDALEKRGDKELFKYRSYYYLQIEDTSKISISNRKVTIINEMQ